MTQLVHLHSDLGSGYLERLHQGFLAALELDGRHLEIGLTNLLLQVPEGTLLT